MQLNGRPPKIVLESDVRRAMKHTLSNAQAAKFLGINKITYKKYASQYFENGVSLYEMHCNPNGKGITRNHTIFRGNKYELQDILDCKVKGYPFFKLKTRLFNEAMKELKFTRKKDIRDQLDSDMYETLRKM